MSRLAKTQMYRAGANSTQERILIIGAGLAGLFLALRLAPRRCTIVSPAPIGEAASSTWAQGGLAAALHPEDSPEQHAADTIAAGAGLVDPVVARMIAEDGSDRVRDLLALGVPFDRTKDGHLALSLEAAHSHPRVARVAGDLAGQAIMGALTAAVRLANHIELIEYARATALLQDEGGSISGAILTDRHGRQSTLTAAETVLCTGGSGGLFRVTTNPPEARGDALAMAHQCGAVIADPEFVQFHPTAMDVGKDPAPLATEALRGEGAILINDAGDAFMSGYHPKGELAPRDEVARAIHTEISLERRVFLDTREALSDRIESHFPTVFSACQAAGFNPIEQPIPVAPAMHYHMGGILSDLWGRASLAGLSVCGECASTGAHGANRLASNSLLEAVVMAARIADRLRDGSLNRPGAAVGYVPDRVPTDTMVALRRVMAEHCGVVRSEDGLRRTQNHIDEWIDAIGPATPLIAAKLITQGALQRQESRGGHYRADFPETKSAAHRTFVYSEPAFQTANETV
ncbi:MAG: L-aspartate oxidase [Pseudomonadota bacterium]